MTTSWVEAVPIPDQRTETVAKCLVNEVVIRYGVPSYIHLDQGRQFGGVSDVVFLCCPFSHEMSRMRSWT